MLQKEAFLKEECRQINKTEPFEGGSEQLEACHKELDNLDWQIWRTERRDYVHTSKMPESPWRRALLTRRKHPEWYMMKYLRWDCAERGGCCGRDCGCCKRPRSTKRPNALSHCTAECDCCTLFRGFELSAEDQKLANPWFHRHDLTNHYVLTMIRNYIFGYDPRRGCGRTRRCEEI